MPSVSLLSFCFWLTRILDQIFMTIVWRWTYANENAKSESFFQKYYCFQRAAEKFLVPPLLEIEKNV